MVPVTPLPRPTGLGGLGGTGGFGGGGGAGGDGGTIDVRVVEVHPLLAPPGVPYPMGPPNEHGVVPLGYIRVAAYADPGEGGAGGVAGSPGKGGKGGKGGRGTGKFYPFLYWLGPKWAEMAKNGFTEEPDWGYAGYGRVGAWEINNLAPEPPPKPAPVPGNRGATKTVKILNPTSTFEAGALTRTSQLQMVLESVRARYLAAGFEPDDSIRQDLTYLAQALTAVAPEHGTEEQIRLQKQSASQLLNGVAVLLRNTTTECDIFGRGRHFVPMLSVATHQNVLKDSLAVLQENERNYDAYRAALQKATDSAEELDLQARKVAALKDYLVGRLAKVNADRITTQADIDRFAEKLTAAEARMKKELDTLKTEIDSQFGLSPATIINCFTQVAFLGAPFEKTMVKGQDGVKRSSVGFSGLHAINSALLGSTQIAAAVNEGLTSVLSDSGEPVKKEHLIERLDAVDPGKLEDHLKARQNGTYVVDDGRKLTMMREDVEQLCSKFRSRLHAADLVHAIKAYADLVEERGCHLQKFNSLVVEALELSSEIRAAKSREAQALSLRTEAALNAAPEMTAMISDLYDRTRLQCLNELSLAYRALAFWKTERYGNVATLIPGKPMVVNYQTLNNAWVSVQNEIIDHLEKAFSPAQRFPAVKDKTTLGLGRSPFGVWIVLTADEYPDEFADLQDGWPARFSFEPNTAVKTKDPAKPILPFHGKADVRLSRVRVFFPDLPCATPPLMVKVMHGGRESVQNPSGQSVEFRHEPRSFTFAYTPPKSGLVIDEEEGWVDAKALLAGGSEDGSLGMATDKTALPGCSYTPVGPFTDWTIELPPGDNPGLDRKKIKRIVIDFQGFHREFARGARA